MLADLGRSKLPNPQIFDDASAPVSNALSSLLITVRAFKITILSGWAITVCRIWCPHRNWLLFGWDVCSRMHRDGKIPNKLLNITDSWRCWSNATPSFSNRKTKIRRIFSAVILQCKIKLSERSWPALVVSSQKITNLKIGNSCVNWLNWFHAPELGQFSVRICSM